VFVILGISVKMEGFPMAERHAILDELMVKGLIDYMTADGVMIRAKKDDKSPIKILIDEGLVTEAEIYKVVAEFADMEFVDPDELQVDQGAAQRLTGEEARRFKALPYAWDGSSILIAVSDPSNLSLKDDLRRITSAEPILVLAAPAALASQINQIYRAGDELGSIASAVVEDNVVTGEVSKRVVEETDGMATAPAIRFVDLLIAQAIADRASDIHIEPREKEVAIRYRIDGVLHSQETQRKAIHSPVVSRIKIMSGMDIAEKRKPQDGRMTVLSQGKNIDLRVVTIPTNWGEKIVMRVLDNSSTPPAVENIGLSEYHQKIYKNHYNKPHGMILITGPTGSGKSTTLYATLNTIKNESINIMTIEDPIESQMVGVSQIQINNLAGLTFATVLRAILRADPDVLLVGEIRDRETANLAVEAAQTGHLVLSTLHTNDASSAVTRLIEMGVEPFLVGSALSLVVAQRLLRRLCEKCSVEFVPMDDQLLSVNFPWKKGTEKPTLRKAVGCGFCAKTGYRGRMGIHEMLEVTSQIERLANQGAATDQIRETAIRENNMKLMRQDGWEKVLQGLTTIEEVLRATK
jgi:type IV pilus assembly protein PilB